jgi:2-polyprenyl-3-methyl-5-hydroxy-6-metoxy-1,4-benzoquinol methylase
MDTVRVSQQDYWQEHFRNQHLRKGEAGIARSMDYPNDRLQVQTYGIVLEALGSLAGKSVLDAGCGWGLVSRLAHLLGASPLGIDFVPETIRTLRGLYPEIRWEVANLSDPARLATLGTFDRVAAIEVLQHMDFESGLAALWDRVASGGRLVGCIPNSLCPFAAGVNKRLDHWVPVSPAQIIDAARTLPGCTALYFKGLTYLEDQTFLPYRSSDWAPELSGTPNRIVFAMLRA